MSSFTHVLPALCRADASVAIGTILLHTGDQLLLERVEAALADPEAFRELTSLEETELAELLGEVLSRHPDRDPREPAPPADRRVVAAIARLVTIPEVTEDYVDKFDSDVTEHHASRSRHVPEPVESSMRIVIIGAGLSGIAMAHELREHGFPYEIYEKHGEPGGVWVENTYPRCGLDTHPFAYAWSFGPSVEWSSFYATRDHVLDYIQQRAHQFGVYERTHFGHELTAAEFDPDRGVWVLTFATEQGQVTTECDILISAVGTLNQPAVPVVPGIEDFAGHTVHTARWDDSIPLDGRVAVVGNGSSGVQVTPALAERAQSLTVFQRSPAWLKARRTEVGEGPVPDWLVENLKQVVSFGPVFRFQLYYRYGDDAHGLLNRRDEKHTQRAEAMRADLEAYIREQTGGDEDLIAKVTPDYQPYVKRMVVDNDWYATLTEDHVELVTSPIVGADREGLRTADGQHYPLDVIVWGTGFRGTEFLVPVSVRGASGSELGSSQGGRHELRAYLGVALPDLPNFFSIQGPNSSIGHGGAATFVGETQSHYIAEVLKHMREHHHRLIEVDEVVVKDYNARMEAQMEHMVWTDSGVGSRYKNENGRIVANHPWTLQEYWNMTRAVQPSDYHFDREG